MKHKLIEILTINEFPLVAWDFSHLTVVEKAKLSSEIVLSDIKINQISYKNGILVMSAEPTDNEPYYLDDFNLKKLIIQFLAGMDIDIACYRDITMTDRYNRSYYVFAPEFIQP
jgi:hypothetical protein